MKSNKKGFARIIAACIYSLQGFRSGFKHEESFRQESVLYLLSIPVLFWLPVSWQFKWLLFSANTIVLMVELLNSAVESVVDLVSPEYDILAKRAKDMGSAAVMLSLILAAVLWAVALYHAFVPRV